MLLPNAADALIEDRKIVDYLLNAAHPDNGGKAFFFTSYGFTAQEWRTLAIAIRRMVCSEEISLHISSRWGEKFIVDGSLSSPRGPTPLVRSVWIVDTIQTVPRLVTAYPRK